MTGSRKLPMRRCIGCSEQKEKKQLIRIVRTPEGLIEPDESGRANGRGAYVCRNLDCLERAVKSHALERSLHCRIDASVYESLRMQLSMEGEADGGETDGQY